MVRCKGHLHGKVDGELLDRLSNTDLLHGDPGHGHGTLGAAGARGYEHPFRGGATLRGERRGLPKEANPPHHRNTASYGKLGKISILAPSAWDAPLKTEKSEKLKLMKKAVGQNKSIKAQHNY